MITLRRSGYTAAGNSYHVVDDIYGVIGEVYKRPGGWWGWRSTFSRNVGQWCKTRKEATQAVVRTFNEGGEE